MKKRLILYLLVFLLATAQVLLASCGAGGAGAGAGSAGASAGAGSGAGGSGGAEANADGSGGAAADAAAGAGAASGDSTPKSGGGNFLSNLFGGNGKDTVEEDENAPVRDNTPLVLDNVADGAKTFEGDGAVIDYSHASEGYIMARYDGDNPMVKLRITKDGTEDIYTYDIVPNAGYAAFPLSAGAGAYNVAAYTNISGDKYAQVAAGTVKAKISDELLPFLRSNHFSEYANETDAVGKGSELAEGARSDLKVIERIFNFITDNVTYDYDKAATVQSGYFPTVDETLETGKGICFDYASLMACMLRTQRIPCKLVVGYAGEAYHAWISVHVDGIGWVSNMIQFNGDEWTMMDPTFAANGDTSDPNLVGDGTNYAPVYYY